MSTPRLHLHLRTADLSASHAFYAALLGSPDKVTEELVRFQPDDLAISLTVMRGVPSARHPEEHLGLKWADTASARAAWERLATAGLVHVGTEEGTSCCGAVQDKRWFLDPDGRPWEVYTVLDESPVQEPTTPVGAVCCGTPQVQTQACCA